MRFAAALILPAFCAATPAAAQTLIAQPSTEDVVLAYPVAALQDGVNGSATVACVIARGGFLDQCSVAAETPAGRGFGDAALSIMRHFRYAPTTASGASSVGVSKRLVVRFSVPDAATSSAPASRDPQP